MELSVGEKFYIVSVAYPGLSLGTSFFMRQNSTDTWESESIGLGYGVKLSKKNYIHIQRVFETRREVS